MAKDDKDFGDLLTGRLQRFMSVGSLSGRVGGSYLWSAILRPFQSEEHRPDAALETHLKNVMRIVESSKELRGTFMKLTQILSMRDDLFPPEALDVLSVVQSGVPPMDGTLIRSRIVEELGAPPEEVFEHFEPEAFAAASLGQVHRARRKDGADVVVKVQYPGVEKTVESDLRNIKSLIGAFKLVARDVMGNRDMDYRGVYQELRERLEEELDYELEALHAELFAELFADDPDIVVPRVFRDTSTRRLLTLEFAEGYKIRDILAPGVDQELKDWVMTKLYDVTWKQFFHFGILHVDPHPGNYLVTHDPHLVMLDFGSVRFLPSDLRDAYRDFHIALLNDDRGAFRDATVRLDFLNEDDDFEPMYRICRRLLGPLLRDEPADPRGYDSLEEVSRAVQEGIRAGYWKAPPHRVFLDRVLIGLDGYLKLSGSVANWHRIFRRWLDEAPRDVDALVARKDAAVRARAAS